MMEVPIRAPARNPPILWDEVALAAVTLLFATTLHPFGLIIAVNGVLCHGSYALSLSHAAHARAWDVLCNVVMCVYVNLDPCAQPFCGAVTLVAVVAWRWNQSTPDGTKKATVHAFFVQLPLFFAMLHYADACAAVNIYGLWWSL